MMDMVVNPMVQIVHTMLSVGNTIMTQLIFCHKAFVELSIVMAQLLKAYSTKKDSEVDGASLSSAQSNLYFMVIIQMI